MIIVGCSVGGPGERLSYHLPASECSVVGVGEWKSALVGKKGDVKKRCDCSARQERESE